ncbi:hypothetical protein yinte0001_12180 [Yersinia intermedia ATCC 29909]|nr:hypothetical protein yinte0001_12180 [Yersinia intermedia ATCC 29909]
MDKGLSISLLPGCTLTTGHRALAVLVKATRPMLPVII